MTSLLGFALTDPSVPTPSFVIEEERLNKNLHRALDQARRLGVTLRPHLKTHKSIGIALRQMETPQGPACVSTLLEAEYFFSHGVTDLLYAVGIAPQKIPQVVSLRERGCDLKIILDNDAAADAVSDFCREHGVSIPVLLEVDVDGHRSGSPPSRRNFSPSPNTFGTAPVWSGFLRTRARATTNPISSMSVSRPNASETGSSLPPKGCGKPDTRSKSCRWDRPQP